MSALLTRFHEGGIFMYFILICGIFAVAFVTERAYTLYFAYQRPLKGFRQQILNFIAKGDFAGAETFAASSAGTNALARVVSRGARVRQEMGGDDEVQARMDETLAQEISLVDRRTGFLGMIGNVSTLIGLLGTISGMITSFAAVAQANPMDRATLLSKGISEAMNCTAFGLLVAIPALVAYAIFQNRTDRVVTELTEETTHIYNDILFMSEAPQGARPHLTQTARRATGNRGETASTGASV